ncbi:OLC1v1030914C1 [Oldenlandia corymbosa var. corymbosa]|uniref:OLC1v1030914C1 n=1 Tax=Oldenlandia corymbosa var. corymbosa TaxID=529605 RepID=A0AAV1CKN3_OLDCO|nr:OLC1v1030914C1 [Oldenlandia corymbosa var. corymbosa]
MRMLKWKLGFRFKEDPPVVPIWVALYDLPIEFMHPEVIYSMATALGQPLKVDAPTINMTRSGSYQGFIKNEPDKNVVPALKKKGFKIKSAKPKWPLKGGKAKNDALEVQILNSNPLVVKGVEMQIDDARIVDAHPMEETLDARLVIAHPAEETLAAQSLLVHSAEQGLESLWLESTSGLSALEKEVIPVDLQESPIREDAEHAPSLLITQSLVQSENRFPVLQDKEDGDIDDDVEIVFPEDNNQEQQNQG